MSSSPSRGLSSTAHYSPKQGGQEADFLIRQAQLSQRRLTAASSTCSAERHRSLHLEEELRASRDEREEQAGVARREMAARVASGELASRMTRERDAAAAHARRTAERNAELEMERTATKKVLQELYAANEAIEAENRSLQATVLARDAALRAAMAEREGLEQDRQRLTLMATAAKEVARKSMEVAEAAEEERDQLSLQVARLRTLLKRTNEAAQALGLTLPSYLTPTAQQE